MDSDLQIAACLFFAFILGYRQGRSGWYDAVSCWPVCLLLRWIQVRRPGLLDHQIGQFGL